MDQIFNSSIGRQLVTKTMALVSFLLYFYIFIYNFNLIKNYKMSKPFPKKDILWDCRKRFLSVRDPVREASINIRGNFPFQSD